MEGRKFNRIKVALVDSGIKNKDLAEHLNVGKDAVSRWCQNKQQPSIEVFYDIADYLQIDVRELLVPNKFASSNNKDR